MFEEFNKKISNLSANVIKDQIFKILPSTISEDVKGDMSRKLEEVLEKELVDIKIASVRLENDIEDTIEKLSKTTKDLEKIPFLGSVGMFLRGMQRPVWGFALLYIDLNVLSGTWPILKKGATDIAMNDTVASAFWFINILILGFLFGERAARNVVPMINKRFGKKE